MLKQTSDQQMRQLGNPRKEGRVLQSLAGQIPAAAVSLRSNLESAAPKGGQRGGVPLGSGWILGLAQQDPSQTTEIDANRRAVFCGVLKKTKKTAPLL